MTETGFGIDAMDPRLAGVDFPGVEIKHRGLLVDCIDLADHPARQGIGEQAEIAASTGGQVLFEEPQSRHRHLQQAIDRIRQTYLSRDVSGEVNFQETAEVVNGSPKELSQLLSTLSRLSVDQVAQEAGITSVRAGEFGRLLDV